jgi:glycogen operon protein
MPDQPRFYINDTGTGNTVNTSQSARAATYPDLLRYWATEMEVDGSASIWRRSWDASPTASTWQAGGFFDAGRLGSVLLRSS